MVVNTTSMKKKYRKVKPSKILKMLKKENNLYIVDVRPQNFKRDSSFIKGSIHCPLLDLEDRYQSFPKDKKILITDWAMKQSPLAAKFLILKGYDVLGVLKGGIERWKYDKCPVENR